MAPHKYNASRHARRIPTRLAAATGVEAELLQVSLALAFTVQQKLLAPSRPSTRVADFLGEGVHPALERIVTCARHLTEATGAALALGDPTSMVCVARSGASAPPVGAVFDAASGLSGESVRTGEATICVNAAADPRVNYQACRALNVASMLYFPLHSAQGQMIGMLGVFSPRPRHFSARDIACLRFTEGLVQEAVACSTADPDPATLGVLLKQADFVEDSDPPETVPVPTVVETTLAAPKFEKLLDASAFEAQPKPALAPVVKPTLVGRIVDESVADLELETPSEANNTSVTEPRSRIPLLLALIVALLIAAAVLVHNRPPQGTPPQPAETKAEPARPAEDSKSTAPQSDSSPAEQMLTAQVSLRSGAANATVTILLPRAIRFEGYQLSNPDRIYFDLHNIKLTDAKGNVFKTDEGLISRVRLSDYASGVTRVVFDLRQPATFEARLEEKPDRLIIEMRRTATSEKNISPDPNVPTRVTLSIEPTLNRSGS